jgi:hypothetical protein
MPYADGRSVGKPEVIEIEIYGSVTISRHVGSDHAACLQFWEDDGQLGRWMAWVNAYCSNVGPIGVH